MSWMTGRILRKFLLTWLVMVLALTGLLTVIYQVQSRARMSVTYAQEQKVVHEALHVINAELGLLQSDILYLAEQSSLSNWLTVGSADAQLQLSHDLSLFALHRGIYDQIRFLDERGREIIRINWHAGRPAIVVPKKLQDKFGRYYVRSTLELPKSKIYISPFDLNVENNSIETPLKPVIRLGTPVYDNAGNKRGAIVVNYLGVRLLDRLRSLSDEGKSGLWLLNKEGYWLLGPRPDMEWGFMYSGRKDLRLSKANPEVWKMIGNAKKHQFIHDGGLYTYAHVQSAQGINAKLQWTLISYVPESVLDHQLAGYKNNFLTMMVIGAAILGLLSWTFSYYSVQAEQHRVRMSESEARFRGLVDSAPDAIVSVDQHGMITLLNRQAESWFGYSRKELIGQPLEKLVPERFREQHIQERNQFMEKPVLRPMAVGSELYCRRKDGTELPVEISLSPLETQQGLLITAIVRDITSRKEVEEQKRQAQSQYQELINNLPVGVYRNTPGPQGRFLEVNPAMVSMFEAESVEALLRYPVSELYVDANERQAFSAKILQKGYVNNEELELKTLRGRRFWGAITAVVKKNAGDDVYFDGIVEDITSRKNYESQINQLNQVLRQRASDLETINQELEAFSYSVSHDLRTPLRAMDGFSRILLEEYGDVLDKKGKDRLTRVRAAAQHMSVLIDDLLKLSRVTRSDLNREPVNMGQLAEQVMSEISKTDTQRDLEFHVQTGLIVQADGRLLRVLLDNLLGNAWKFTGNTAKARIELGIREEGGEVIYFVRDNGAGFEMAYAEKLFGAFQRLHDEKEFPGTGIGLATVKRVVHKHGGRIWAESAVGQGATFYFTLGKEGMDG